MQEEIYVDIGNVLISNGQAGQFDDCKPEAIEAIKNLKFLGIYFSAHWCGPCQAFTPQLRTFYEAVQEEFPAEFEIIFASSDSDQNEFKDYYTYENMPWYAFEYGDPIINELKDQLQVLEFPLL